MAQPAAGTTQFQEDAETLTKHASSWIGIRARGGVFGSCCWPSRRSAWPHSS
jgi:hypothetical protein